MHFPLGRWNDNYRLCEDGAVLAGRLLKAAHILAGSILVNSGKTSIVVLVKVQSSLGITKKCKDFGYKVEQLCGFKF